MFCNGIEGDLGYQKVFDFLVFKKYNCVVVKKEDIFDENG